VYNGVFPTDVGVDRCDANVRDEPDRIPRSRGDGSLNTYWHFRIPRRRGGGSQPNAELIRAILFSPRRWGWFAHVLNCAECLLIFPAFVGMVRAVTSGPTPPYRFPRICGGGSPFIAECRQVSGYSPQARGWIGDNAHRVRSVFPTVVGVARPTVLCSHEVCSFPAFVG